jgi:peptidylprolyl isomerase
LYIWSGTTHKLLGSTFKAGAAPTLLVGGQAIPGLKAALVGQKLGSRVLAVVPPKEGFGSSGNSQVGITGTDTLVFVVDMVKAYPGTSSVAGATAFNGGSSLPTVTAAPGKVAVITVPASKPPKTLTVKTLVKGTGPKIVNGDLAVLQYTGVLWKAGKPTPFDSSWSRSQPYSLTVGAGSVIPGWDKGLVGQTAGSRVMLVIPPADAYGSSSPSSSIPANSTLVFVIDIVGVYSTQK